MTGVAQGCHQSTSRLSLALPAIPHSLHAGLCAIMYETDSRPYWEAPYTKMPACLQWWTGQMYHARCAERCVFNLLCKQHNISVESLDNGRQDWKANWVCLLIRYSPNHRLYTDNIEARWKGKDLLGYRPLFSLDDSLKHYFVSCSCCL